MDIGRIPKSDNFMTPTTHMRLSTLLVLAVLMLPFQPLAGPTMEPHQRIRDAARAHIERHFDGETGLTVEIGRLDRRLRLPRCPVPLETFSPGGYPQRPRQKQTVGVRCPEGQGWSIYVPATIRLIRPVLVTNQPVSRGSPLGVSDVRLEERDVAALRRGYLEHPEQLRGRVAKRDLATGQVISPNQLSARRVVRRGNRVTILARVGGILVRVAGKALGDAGIGERVRVENSSSGRRIEATAVAAGIVEVSL